MKRIQLLLVCCILMQTGIDAAVPEKFSWNDLAPAERQLLQGLQGEWDNLPAERQQQLRRGAARWLNMRPEERQSARAIERRFQSLSPQQQQLINQRFQRFNGLDRERQQKLRSMQQRFRNLPQAERARLQEQFQNRERPESATESTPRSPDARPAPAQTRQPRPLLRGQDSAGVRPAPIRPGGPLQRQGGR